MDHSYHITLSTRNKIEAREYTAAHFKKFFAHKKIAKSMKANDVSQKNTPAAGYPVSEGVAAIRDQTSLKFHFAAPPDFELYKRMAAVCPL
jgi:hypothetical protein